MTMDASLEFDVTLAKAEQTFKVCHDGQPVSRVKLSLGDRDIVGEDRWAVSLDDKDPIPGVDTWLRPPLVRRFAEESDAQEYAQALAVALARARVALADAEQAIHDEHLAAVLDDGAKADA